MIVDVHTHVWDRPEQLGPGSAARIRQGSPDPASYLDISSQTFDAAMEPVRHAIILGFRSRRIDAWVPHELIAKNVGRRPDKYLGFAGIDPMADDYLDQLAQAVELGLVGVTLCPAAQGFNPSHTRAMKLYERCQELGLPVLVHTSTHLDIAAMMEFGQPHLFDEVGRAFPELRLVLAQVGHPWIEPALMLIGKHQHFYADLSNLVLRPWQLYNVLLSAHQQDVIDRLLIGSDFPFSTPEKTIVTIYSVNTLTHGTNLPTIPREQLRSIVERDALACLGISPKPAPHEKEPESVAAPTGASPEPALPQPDAINGNLGPVRSNNAR